MEERNQQLEQVQEIELSIEEFDIVDLDDRLELAFRCDIKLAAAE